MTFLQCNQAPNRPWYGASWKIAAFACYAGLNGIARYLSGGAETTLQVHLPVTVIVFFQDFFGLLLLLPWILRRGRVAWIPQHLPIHLFRVITSAMAIIAWYLALVYLPLAEAVALSIIGPLIGVLGAKWFLKESFSKSKIMIILVTSGFACWLGDFHHVFIDNWNNKKGLFFLIIAAFLFATAKCLTRKLAQVGETAHSLTCYLFIFIVPVSFIPAYLDWVTPSLAHWPWLLLAGGFTALAIYCVSNALVHAQVSFLAPFDICQFILNVAVGYLAFMEIPSPWAIWLFLAFIGFSFTLRKKVFL